jgi:leader peptidase (prepilin peptidase)/N-methyltransferase
MASVIVFIAGLFIGSFLGVVIKRFERPKSIIAKPSQCDRCKKRLGVLDLIPILSFILSKGRCRFCGRSIIWFYPVVELATGAVLALNWYFLTQQGASLFTVILYSIIVLALVVIVGIDLVKMVVPNSLVVLIALMAIVNLTYTGNWTEAAGGMVVGAGFLGVLALLGRGKWMGWGDVKLAGALGLWLGSELTVSMLFLGFVIGAAVSVGLLIVRAKRLKDHLAFAPFLALASLMTLWLNLSILDFIRY